MAWNFTTSSPLRAVPPWKQSAQGFPTKNCTGLAKLASSRKYLFSCKAAQSEDLTEESSATGSSARTQLDLLEQLTSSTTTSGGYDSGGESGGLTIREQLSIIGGDTDGEFTLRLGKKLKASLNLLTVSQKRNIKRQAYLNEVSKRNDSVFFATVGAFVILPPVVILAIAILTGYVQLFP